MLRLNALSLDILHCAKKVEICSALKKEKEKRMEVAHLFTFCDKQNLLGHFPQACPIAEDLGH